MIRTPSTISREDLDALKTTARFDLAEELCAPLAGKWRQDPAHMDVLKRIAAGLSARGYNVTKVKPWSYGVGCRCRLAGSCEVAVCLHVDREKKGYVNCYLSTFWFRGRSEHNTVPDPACVEQWMHLGDAIRDIIVEVYRGTSVLWMTDAEAAAFERAMYKES